MNAELKQCIDSYRTELIKNIADTSAKTPLLKKLSAIAAAKKNTYSAAPLQCPSNIDVYADIVAVRTYEADTTALLLQNSMLENMFLTGNLQALQDACESKDSQQ